MDIHELLFNAFNLHYLTKNQKGFSLHVRCESEGKSAARKIGRKGGENKSKSVNAFQLSREICLDYELIYDSIDRTLDWQTRLSPLPSA